MITFKAKTKTGEIIKSALSPFTFPAGEAHTKREERRSLEPTEIAILQFTPDSIHDDLFQLAMWNDLVMGEDTFSQRVVVIPYFPGARADRGHPFGVGVYAEFFASLGVNRVILFDPHSPETLDQLKFAVTPSTAVYSDELLTQPHYIFHPNLYAGVIAPDKGAVERTRAVAEALEVPLFKAEKTRNFETGKLTGFTVEDLPKNGNFLLIDDICDGGGTFLGLAEATGLPKERLHLFVSHGVFSKNAFETLPTKFDRIFTTNSYAPDRELPAEFSRLEVIRLLLSKI